MIETQPFLGFVVLVALGYVAAKLAEVLICRGMTRLTAKTETELDDRLIELLHRPVFQTVFLASLALANQLHHGKTFEEVAEGLRAVLDGFAPGVRR